MAESLPPARERILQWSNPLQDVIFRVRVDTKLDKNKEAKYGQTYLELLKLDGGYGGYFLCSKKPADIPQWEIWTFVLGFVEQWKYNYEIAANLPDQWPTLTQTWVLERAKYDPKMTVHPPPDSTKVRVGGVWTRMGETEMRIQDEDLDSLFIVLRITWEDHTIPLLGWEVRQDTGEAFQTVTERVPAGTVGSGSNSSGTYSEITAVNDVWALRITKTNSGLSTKEPFTDYTENPQTGEKFPRVREIKTVSEAAALAQAVDATGKYVTTEQITLAYSLVTTQYDTSLVTGVEFVNWELDRRSGLTMPLKRRIVNAGVSGASTNNDGVYVDVERLTLGKSLTIERLVTAMQSSDEITWQEWRAFPWPPVLTDYGFIQYPRGNFGFEYDMKVYSGEVRCDVTLVWTKDPPEELTDPVIMIPTTIKWGGAGAFTLPACLHEGIIITETEGGSTYSKTYPATNYEDWPDVVTRLLSVEPFMGGFFTTYGDFYKPET